MPIGGGVGLFDEPHLREHLATYAADRDVEPRLVEGLHVDEEPPAEGWDLVYPLADGVYVHIHPEGGTLQYTVVEPRLTEGERVRLEAWKERIFEEAMYRPPPKDQEELESDLLELLGKVMAADEDKSPVRRDVVEYHLLRDIARYGVLQPFTLDRYLEDIQAVGLDAIHVIHKYFDMLPTNVSFPDMGTLDRYVRNLSERIGRPVSDARPIVDATLRDGSRINIVYSSDVSRKGPSFSIRRVQATPISITQLIQWGTLSAQIAAYLWLCLENGMSLMVCGEAACGKSATLNAILPFVDLRSKLYSAEDTPEIRPPHPVWQRLLTRETGPEESRVKTFDLLKAALRSRPNYIVVGEIRGAEGAVAFQAMQTGHPTVATFHATDKVKLIQRLSAPPINIPLSFMDNLNVAVFQQAMYQHGRLIRRVTSLDEIQGYSSLDKGVVTLPVFSYDRELDAHHFDGNNNSFVLETKIAEQHGYEDPSEIYGVLNRRRDILQTMVEKEILDYDEVNAALIAFSTGGEEALPFGVVTQAERDAKAKAAGGGGLLAGGRR